MNANPAARNLRAAPETALRGWVTRVRKPSEGRSEVVEVGRKSLRDILSRKVFGALNGSGPSGCLWVLGALRRMHHVCLSLSECGEGWSEGSQRDGSLDLASGEGSQHDWRVWVRGEQLEPREKMENVASCERELVARSETRSYGKR